MAGPGGVEGGRVSVRVLPDTSKFAVSLQKYLERIEARTLLKIRTATDTAKIGAQVAAAVKAAEKTATVHFGAKLDSGGVAAEARRAAKTAEKTARLTLPVKLDIKAAAAAIGTLAALLAGGLASGTKVLALAGAVAQAAALGKALAPAAGLLAAIPGLALVAAAAVATLKIGFKGVGDALAGDAEAFAKLAPAAKSFVTQARALAPAWQAFQSGIQQQLFTGLAAELGGLSSAVLPLLRKNLGGIAEAWNTAFRGAAQFAQTPAFLNPIGEALGHATSAGQSLSGVLVPLLSILANLAPLGAELGADLAGGLSGAAQSAAAFVARARETGQLAEWFANARAVAAQLGVVLQQVGGIAAAVFNAAAQAGGGLLGNLTQILTSVNAFFSAGEGQSALQSFFTSAATVLKELLPIVLTLAGGIGSVLAPAIAGVAQALGPGLQGAAQSLVGIVKALVDSGALDALASALSQGLGALGPALIPLAASLGSIVKAAAPLLGLLGKIGGILAGVLASALTAVEPLLSALVDGFTSSGLDTALAAIGAALGPLIGQLISALLPIIKALLPILAPIVQVIGALLLVAVKLLEPILALITPLIELLALKVLAPIVQLLADALLWLVEKALLPAAEWFGKLAGVVGSLDWAAIWQMIVDGIGKLFVWLVQLQPRILAWLAGLAVDLLMWAHETMTSWGTNILNGLLAIVGFFASLPGRALGAVFSLRDRLLGFLGELWARGKELFVAGVQAGVDVLASLPGRARAALSTLAGSVLGVFGDAGSWLWDAGRRIIDGLISGISAMVGKLKDKLRSITNMLPDWKGPARVDKRLLAPSGRLILAGLMDGIDAATPALQSQLAGITRDISRTFATGAASVAPQVASAPVPPRAPSFDPGDARAADPVVNVVAEVRIGDGPVIDAVETAVKNNPDKFAAHVATGQRQLARRG